MEKVVASAGWSLRKMVTDWLAPDPTRGFRISHVGRSGLGRYVCVVADNGAESRAMFFYRHRDGKWCIHPPEPERPAMRVTEFAADRET
ncbi:conserved hypothetical protein [Paraburkholderia phymatum STM815]|uniref:Uncharacterized protein n=1 Tax=Paraburkholderia phymatum (strain DSM 17167 / CIP 108236 / LMG 21445 / STM815) TaxID=391038 RepID=B2JRK6_PARP8|nr:conserved hypothetical protein [Paraburkholderia phymatum STM815]